MLRPPALSNLAFGLQQRYRLHGAAADLDEAVGVLRQAADAARPGTRAEYLSSLALAQQSRYELTGDLDDLEDAVSAARAALRDAEPADPRYVRWLNTGTVLHNSYEAGHDPDDLHEAWYAHREAVRAAGREAPGWPIFHANLADVLLTVHHAERDGQALQAALDLMTAALTEVTPDRPEYGIPQLTAGKAYRERGSSR